MRVSVLGLATAVAILAPRLATADPTTECKMRVDDRGASTSCERAGVESESESDSKSYELKLEDVCKHQPHLDVCDGVEREPYEPRIPASGEFEGGVRLGLVENPETLGGTERIAVGEFRLLAAVGRRLAAITLMDVGFGGGSGGGVFGRVELGVGGRVHLPNFDLDAWATLGVDGLSGGRMDSSMLPGIGARASLRFPRITMRVRAERFTRVWEDRMTGEPIGGGVTRYGATLMVGHQLPLDLSDDSYSQPYVDLEVERLPQDSIVWISFGASWYVGELPR